MRTAIFLFAGFFISPVCFSQIVNMESERYRTDTTGWRGSVSGNFAVTNFGEQVIAANAQAHVQYQSKKSLYLLLGSYGFLKGEEQSFIDNGFLHFRYNYKINKAARWEAFIQVQQNAITKIESRMLMGTGPRFKILGQKKFRVYAATLAMFESEKETGKAERINDWRSSSYISFTILPTALSEITSTTYYQPVILDGKDYRLLNQLLFKLNLSKHFAVNLNWTYQYDSTPAAGVRKGTYNFNTGLEVKL